MSVYLNTQLTSILQVEFFPKTPKWVTLIAGVTVFSCIAYKGVSGVTRFFEITGPVILVGGVVVHLMMLKQGEISNALPLFRASEVPRYLAAAPKAIFPFLGVEMLSFVPFTMENSKKTIRTVFFTLLFIGVFYVLVVETSIMMIGIHDIQNYNFALIEAIKLVDNPVLERFDIIYLTVGFAGLIAGISVYFLALTEFACSLFLKMNRKAVVFLFAVLITAGSMFSNGIKKPQEIFEPALTIAGLCVAFLVPAILFVIAKVRGLGHKPG